MSNDNISLVYKKEHRKALAYIKKQISNKFDSYDEEDILQDVFYKLASSSSITLPLDKLTYYLYRSIKNKIIDLYRKKRLKTTSIDKNMDKSEDYTLQTVLKDFSFSPEDEYTKEYLRDEIFTAVELLPEKQREVFILTELEGLSYKEVAELTNTSVNTLLSRKRYAISKLQSVLLEKIQ